MVRRNLMEMRLEREVAGIVKMHFRARQSRLKASAPAGTKV